MTELPEPFIVADHGVMSDPEATNYPATALRIKFSYFKGI